MCLGSPKAPNIVYQGPSAEDVAQQQASLNQYKTQMDQQQSLFQGQLQSQIDAANEESDRLKTQLEQESDAAAAAAAQQQTGAYAATATQSEAPTTAQTTAAVTKKNKPKSSLKISSAAVPTTAGTGLNIGV
jgi:cell division septation protein DedD